MENNDENIQMIELPRLHPSAYSWLYNSCTILSLAEYVREDDFLTPPPTPVVPPNSPAEGVRPRASTQRTHGSTTWETQPTSKREVVERSRWLESLAAPYMEERPPTRSLSKRRKVRDEIAAWELWRTRMLAFRAPDPPFLFPLRMHALPPFGGNQDSMQGRRRNISPSDSYYAPSFSSTSPFIRQSRLLDLRSNSYSARLHGSSVDTMRTLGNVESLRSESRTQALNINPNSTNDLMSRSFHWKERPSYSYSKYKLSPGDSTSRRENLEREGIKRTWSSFHNAASYKRKKRLLAQLRGREDEGKSATNACLNEYVTHFKDKVGMDRYFDLCHGEQSNISREKSKPPLTAPDIGENKDVSRIPSREKMYRKKSINKSSSQLKENENAKKTTRNSLRKMKSSGSAIIIHKNQDFQAQSDLTKSRGTITNEKSTDDETPDVSTFQKVKSISLLDNRSRKTVFNPERLTMDTSDPTHKRKPVIDEKKPQYEDVLLNVRKPLSKDFFSSYMTKMSYDHKLASEPYKTWPSSPTDVKRKLRIHKNVEPSGNIAAPERVDKKITAIKEMLHRPLSEEISSNQQGYKPKKKVVGATKSSLTTCSISVTKKNETGAEPTRRVKNSVEPASPRTADNKYRLSMRKSELSVASIVSVKRKKLSKGVSNTKTKDSEPNKQTPPKRKEANERQTSAGTKKDEERAPNTPQLHKKKVEKNVKSVPKGKFKPSLKEYHQHKIKTIKEFNEFGSGVKLKDLSDSSVGKDSLKKRLRALKFSKIGSVLPKRAPEGAVLPTFTPFSTDDVKEKGAKLKREKRHEKAMAASPKLGKDESGSSKSIVFEQRKTKTPLQNNQSTLINYIHHIKMNTSTKEKKDFLSQLRSSIQKRPGFMDAKTRCHQWKCNEELIVHSPDDISDMSSISEYFRKRRNLKPVKGVKRKPLDSEWEKVHDLQVRVASPAEPVDKKASVSELETEALVSSSDSNLKTVSSPIDDANSLIHFVIPESELGGKMSDTMEKFKNIHKLKAIGSDRNLWKVLKEGKRTAKCFRFPSRTITTIKENDDPTKSLYLSQDSTNLFSDEENSSDAEVKVKYWPEKSDEDENAPKESPKHKPSRPFYWPNDPNIKTGSNRYGIDTEETHPQFNACIRSRTDLSTGDNAELLDDMSLKIIKGSNYSDTVNFTEDTTDLSLSFTFSDISSIHRLDSTVDRSESDSLTELNIDASRAQIENLITDVCTQTPLDLTEMRRSESQLPLNPRKIYLPSNPPSDKNKEMSLSNNSQSVITHIDSLHKASTHASDHSDETASGLLFDDGRWTYVPAPPPVSAGLQDTGQRQQAIKSLSQEWRLDFDKKAGSPKAFHGNVPGIRHAIFGGRRMDINDYTLNMSYSQQLADYKRRSASKNLTKIPQHILRALKKAVAHNKKVNIAANKFTAKRPSPTSPRAWVTGSQNLLHRSNPKKAGPESGDKCSSPPRESHPPLRTFAHGIAFPSNIVVQRAQLGKNQRPEKSPAPDADITKPMDSPLTSVEHFPQNATITRRRKRPRRKRMRHRMLETLEEEPTGDDACLVGMTHPQRMSLLNQMNSMMTPFPSRDSSYIDEDRMSPIAKKMRLEDPPSINTRPATSPDKHPRDRRHMSAPAHPQRDTRIIIRESQKKIEDDEMYVPQSHFPVQPIKYKSFPGSIGNTRSKYIERPYTPLTVIPETTVSQDPPKSSETTGSPRTSLHSKNVSRQDKRMSSRGTDRPTTATSEIIINDEDSLSSSSLTNGSLRRFSMFSSGNQYWPDRSRHNECVDGNWQLQQYREATAKAWRMIAQGKEQSQEKSVDITEKAPMMAKLVPMSDRPASCIEYLKRRLEEEEQRLHHLTTRRRRTSLLGTSSFSHTTTLFSLNRNLPSSPTGTTLHSGLLNQLLSLADNPDSTL